VQIAFGFIAESQSYIKTGKLVPLTSSAEKAERIPDVPTIAEVGYRASPLFWGCFMAPAGTPPRSSSASTPRSSRRRCSGDGRVARKNRSVFIRSRRSVSASSCKARREVAEDLDGDGDPGRLIGPGRGRFDAPR